MRVFLLIALSILAVGCLSETKTLQHILGMNATDSDYETHSLSASQNSGGTFTTETDFAVRAGEITTGTITKYSKNPSGAESNETFTLEKYMQNEFWRNEFHTQGDVIERLGGLVQTGSFKIGATDCFKMQNNETVQTIKLDAFACFDKYLAVVYIERGDYGRGGYFYWNKKGYENTLTVLRAASGY